MKLPTITAAEQLSDPWHSAQGLGCIHMHMRTHMGTHVLSEASAPCAHWVSL